MKRLRGLVIVPTLLLGGFGVSEVVFIPFPNNLVGMVLGIFYLGLIWTAICFIIFWVQKGETDASR